MSNWAIQVCSICFQALLKVKVSWLERSNVLDSSHDFVTECCLIVSPSGVESLAVVVGHSLLGSSRDTVVVLVDSHGIKHVILTSQNIRYLLRFILDNILVDHRLSIELGRSLKIMLASPDLSFAVGSGREVSSPVIRWFIRVGEHVIVLDRPGVVESMNCVDVLTDSGVLEGVLISIVFIEIVNHPVKIYKEHLCIDPLEVSTKEHHDLIRGKVLSIVIKEIFPFLSLLFTVEGSHRLVIFEVVAIQVKIEGAWAEVQISWDEVVE